MGLLIFFSSFVIPAGFEPTTHSLEGCCSIQLSYGTNSLKSLYTHFRTYRSVHFCPYIQTLMVCYHFLAVQNYIKYINPPNFSAIVANKT